MKRHTFPLFHWIERYLARHSIYQKFLVSYTTGVVLLFLLVYSVFYYFSGALTLVDSIEGVLFSGGFVRFMGISFLGYSVLLLMFFLDYRYVVSQLNEMLQDALSDRKLGTYLEDLTVSRSGFQVVENVKSTFFVRIHYKTLLKSMVV